MQQNKSHATRPPVRDGRATSNYSPNPSFTLSLHATMLLTVYIMVSLVRMHQSMLSDFSFHAYTVGSPAQSVRTALQQLMDTHHLTTSQVDREIQQEDIPFFAVHFDNVEFYIYLLELTPGEQSDVMLKKTESNHLAMTECLTIWRRKKPSQATFRALLEMLARLKKEGIAAEVCQYMKVSVCVHVPFNLCMSSYRISGNVWGLKHSCMVEQYQF